MLAAFDGWIFVLLVAMAAMLRWLASKATAPKDQDGSQDKPTTQPDQPARETPVSNEEQIRKFLEALGQPKTSKPPPPVTPRTDIPPRPVAPVQPPRTMVPPIPSRPAAETRRKVISPETPQRTPATKAAEWLKKIQEAGQEIEGVERPSPPPIPTVVGKSAARRRASARSPESSVEAYAIAPAEAPTELVRIDLQVLLAAPSGLRNAIILREILGPPRGIEPFEFSGVA
jgi:hypothetical protein